MELKVRKRVFELTNNDQVLDMPMARLIDEVICPIIMGRPGCDGGCRYRITPRFMQLMADFAPAICAEDYYRGTTLLTLAMQRLSRSGLRHEPTSYQDLPKEYLQYSAMYDEAGELGKEEWNFFKSQAEYCLSLPETREYMKKLLFGLVDFITPQGYTRDGMSYQCYNMNLDGKEIREWAYNIIIGSENILLQEVYEHFATPERVTNTLQFFRDNWEHIDRKDLVTRLNITGCFKQRKLRKMIFG